MTDADRLLDPPAARGLSLRVEDDPLLPRLLVAGELDLATTDDLLAALREAEAACSGRLEVDLEGVTFADCSGARPLVELTRRAAAAGGEVRVTHPRAAVARVLAHLGLAPVTPPAGGLPAPRAGA